MGTEHRRQAWSHRQLGEDGGGGGTWKEGPRAGVDQAPCRNRMLPRCPKSVNGGQVDILEAESRVNLASLGGFRGRGEVGGMWKRKIPTEDK